MWTTHSTSKEMAKWLICSQTSMQIRSLVITHPHRATGKAYKSHKGDRQHHHDIEIVTLALPVPRREKSSDLKTTTLGPP